MSKPNETLSQVLSLLPGLNQGEISIVLATAQGMLAARRGPFVGRASAGRNAPSAKVGGPAASEAGGGSRSERERKAAGALSPYAKEKSYQDFKSAQKTAEAAAKAQGVLFKDLRGPEKDTYIKARDHWFRQKQILLQAKTKTAPSSSRTATSVLPNKSTSASSEEAEEEKGKIENLSSKLRGIWAVQNGTRKLKADAERHLAGFLSNLSLAKSESEWVADFRTWYEKYCVDWIA